MPNDSIIKTRVFATPSHIYQLTVSVPKVRFDSKDIDKFFNSFRVLAETERGMAPVDR